MSRDYEKYKLGLKKNKEVFVSRKRNNDHVFISGSSGSGKTTMLVTLVLIYSQILGKGVLLFNSRDCFNPEYLHEGLGMYLMKVRKVMDVVADKLHLSLFDKKTMNDGTEESDEKVIDRVTELLARVVRLTPSQEMHLREAVEDAFYEDGYKESGISYLKQYLELQKGTASSMVLSQLRSLLEDNLIVDGNDFDEISGVMSIDTNELEHDAQTLFSNFILEYIFREAMKGRYKDKGIVLVLDECQNYSFDKNSALYKLINEGRKYGVTLIMAATELPSKKAESVVEQCATTLIFKPSETESSKIAKKIMPSNIGKMKLHLSRLKKGEFIAVGEFEDIDENRVDYPVKLSCDIEHMLEYIRGTATSVE